MHRPGIDLLTKLFETDPLLAEVFDELKNEPGDVYLVGGTLRDLLLDKDPADIDIVISCDIEKSVRRLARKFSANFFVLDKKRDYYRLMLQAGRSITIDFTPVEGSGIKADLGRRDFTMNAMAIDLRNTEFIDPYGGKTDIEKSSIRMVAEENMIDDPLRLLRAFRFMTCSGFSICARTGAAIKKHAAKISSVAGERIGAELLVILRNNESTGVFRELHKHDLLCQIFPELTAGESVTQNEWHHLDIFDHSLESLKNLEMIVADLPDFLKPFEVKISEELLKPSGGGYSRAEIVKLATLLHDIGKVSCRKKSGGRMRFIGHDKVGAEMIVAIGGRLKLPKSVTQSVTLLIGHHLRPFNAITSNGISNKALFRFIRDLRGFHIGALLLAIADSMATCGKLVTQKRRETEKEAAVKVLSDKKSTEKPLVTGREIMEITGLKEGKEIGMILEKIAELYAIDEIRNRNEAVAYLQSRRI